jgi:hypothetical protein
MKNVVIFYINFYESDINNIFKDKIFVMLSCADKNFYYKYEYNSTAKFIILKE